MNIATSLQTGGHPLGIAVRAGGKHGFLLSALFVTLCGGEALVDLVPVDGVPPGREVVGTAVLVLEVVGVLPDVVAEDGVAALGDGVVLVGGGDDGELAGFE